MLWKLLLMNWEEVSLLVEVDYWDCSEYDSCSSGLIENEESGFGCS